MSAEDIEIENVDRAERLLVEKHGELSNGLVSHLNRFRNELTQYEIDETLLDRISVAMYEIVDMSDVKDVEVAVKHLNDTFYHQIGDE